MCLTLSTRLPPREQTSVPHHVWMKDPHKSLIVGAVVEVRERTVIVETNGVLKEIPFNAFVMCTGTSYPHFKEDGHPTMEGRNLFFFDCAEKIRKAERIIIAGGGTSGCELCGEIMHAFPDKKVTLVHTKDRVMTVPTFLSCHASLFF